VSSPSDKPTPASAGPDSLPALLVSCFGLGFVPVASGTFGTLGGVGLALALAYLPGLPYAAWLLLATAVLFAAGIPLGDWAGRRYGKDPSEFVLDEVAGYLVTVAVFAAVFGRPLQSWQGHAIAFVLFRAADVLKPQPARRLESLPGGLGIMADDLMAGVYAGGVLALAGWWGLAWL
jgi:phosphatidylglycerophosphatase A